MPKKLTKFFSFAATSAPPEARKMKSAQVLKMLTADTVATFSGVASNADVDSYGDRMLPGAFDGVDAAKVKMFFGHEYGLPVGVFDEITATDAGLEVAGVVLATALGRDLAVLLRNGALDGLSVGGFAVDYAPNDFGGIDIKKFELIEISIVTFPAVADARLIPAEQETNEPETVENARLLRELLTKI